MNRFAMPFDSRMNAHSVRMPLEWILCVHPLKGGFAPFRFSARLNIKGNQKILLKDFQMRLERTYYQTYTKGHLELPSGRRIYTLELPLEVEGKRNVPRKCCIPEGQYRIKWLKRSGSGKYRNVAWLTGVEGRAGILVHNGNLLKHTLGCILVGMREGEGPVVWDSIAAKNALWEEREAIQEISILEEQVEENRDGRYHSRWLAGFYDWRRSRRLARINRFLDN